MSLVLDEALLDDLDPAEEAGFCVSKTCSSCGEEKPLNDDNFRWRRPGAGYPRGGYRSLCIVCERADTARRLRERRREGTGLLESEALPPVGADLLDLPPVTDAEAAWKLKARCRGLRWFEYSTTQQKQVCSTCTAVAECRALCDLVESTEGFRGSHNKQVGVWGGEAPADRRRRREFIAQLQGGVRG